MNTAYSYLRFSTPAQRKGDSYRRQMKLAADYAAKFNLRLDTSHQDLGLSAFKAEHRSKGALGAFLAKVENGEIERGSFLLIENIDRLSREKVLEHSILFQSIVQAGVTIVTLKDGRAYSAESINENWTELIITLAEMARAYGESADKAVRVREAKAENREKARSEGRTLTKTMPPWIVIRDGLRTVDQGRALIVRQIFEMVDGGIGGRTKVARELHRLKIPPFEGQRKSEGWHESFISRLLCNRAVLGEFQPHTFVDGKRVPAGDPITNYFPPIVDAGLFARVNAGAASRKEMMGGRKSEKIANLVSGLVKCRECGGTMRYREKSAEGSWRTVGGKPYRRNHADASLVCSNAERGNGCGNRANIAYHALETALLDSCLHLALDDQAFSNRGEVGRITSLIAERRRALELASERAERLWSAWADGGSDMAKKLAETAEAEAGELRTNLEALERQRNQAKGRADQTEHLRRVADIRAKLYDPDLSIRVPLRRKVAEAFMALIKQVTCNANGSAVTFIADAALIIIDRKGKVTSGFDLVKEGREIPELADYAKRRRKAKDEGDLFRREDAASG